MAGFDTDFLVYVAYLLTMALLLLAGPAYAITQAELLYGVGAYAVALAITYAMVRYQRPRAE